MRQRGDVGGPFERWFAGRWWTDEAAFVQFRDARYARIMARIMARIEAQRRGEELL